MPEAVGLSHSCGEIMYGKTCNPQQLHPKKLPIYHLELDMAPRGSISQLLCLKYCRERVKFQKIETYHVLFQEFIREGCLQKFSRKGYQQRMFFLVSSTAIPGFSLAAWNWNMSLENLENSCFWHVTFLCIVSDLLLFQWRMIVDSLKLGVLIVIFFFGIYYYIYYNYYLFCL